MKISLKEFEERDLSIDGDGKITDSNGNEYRAENGEVCQLDEKRYKVEFIQTETFIVDVLALDEQEATDKANEKWCEGEYQETGNLNVEVGTVYDITNTDDPFNP